MVYRTHNTGPIYALMLLLACSDPAGLGSGVPAPGTPGPTPDDSAATPQAPSNAFTLRVTPTTGNLSTTEQGRTLYLSVSAWDQQGRELNTFGNGNPDGSYGHRHTLATFTTSNSSVATVSSSGTVLGIAPGTAVITVSLTLSGATQQASVSTTVRAPSALAGAYPNLTGSYDFAATFLTGDLDWFPGSGTRWTATLTIQHTPASPSFTGTFTDLRSTVPGGASYPGGSGTVRGQVDHDGRVAIQLSFGQNSVVDFAGYGALVSEQITGTFSSLYPGEFTAARTEAN